MDLHLEEQEASLTYETLKIRLGELRTEVRHNKESSTRRYLKDRERILKHVLSKFSGIREETLKNNN